MARNRAWVFTINNYTEDDLLSCDELGCKYMLYGKEVGDSGTPHLQGMLYLRIPQTMAALSKKLPRARLAVQKGTFEQASVYCKKDGAFTERGTLPMDSVKKGMAEQERWSTALAQAKAGEELEDPQIAFVHARTVSYIRSKELQKKQRVDSTEENLWYWGESGTGKSRKAREDHPDAYLKMANKWWDGYEEEDTVLLEDLDMNHIKLCHHIKIWADRYAFPVELKGSSTKIRPQRLIVTSNYHPRDLWCDPRDLEPILRRFKVVEFKSLANNDTE